MTTVAYPPVTATPTGPASRPVWRALARAESRHLIRPPGFVASCAAMSVVFVLATVAGVDFSTLALSGFACLPLGVGTFVAVPGGYWQHPGIAPRTELVGFDVASLGWHLLYLGGLGGLAASPALARHRLTPATASVAAVTFAAAVGGVLRLR